MDKHRCSTVQDHLLSRSRNLLMLSSLAAHSSNIPCIKLLLELGADPSIPDNDGELPSSVAQTNEERAAWSGH